MDECPCESAEGKLPAVESTVSGESALAVARSRRLVSSASLRQKAKLRVMRRGISRPRAVGSATVIRLPTTESSRSLATGVLPTGAAEFIRSELFEESQPKGGAEASIAATFYSFARAGAFSRSTGTSTACRTLSTVCPRRTSLIKPWP